MKKKVNIKLGLIFALVAVIISSFTLYQIYLEANAKIKIPVVVCTSDDRLNIPVLKAGDVIKEENIEYREVTRGSLLPYTVLNGEELVGNFVARDYYPLENFYYNSITTNYPQRLKEKIRYQAIAIPVSLISTVNGEISPDDFVKIDIILGSGAQKDVLSTNGILPSDDCQIIETDYLKAVRVVGMYEGDGSDSVKIRDKDGIGTRNTISPSFLIVDVNTIQHPLLMYAKRMGSIEVTIIPESEQDAYRQAWGLSIDPNEITGSVDEGVLNDIIAEDEKNGAISIEDGNAIAKDEIEKVTGQSVDDIPTEDEETENIMNTQDDSIQLEVPEDNDSGEASVELSDVNNEAPLELGNANNEAPIELGEANNEAPLELGDANNDTPLALGEVNNNTPIELGQPSSDTPTSIGQTNIPSPSPVSEKLINYKSLLQQMPDEYKANLNQTPNDCVISISGPLLENIRLATQQ